MRWRMRMRGRATWTARRNCCGGSEADPAQSKLIEGLIEYRRGRFAEAKTLFQGVLALQAGERVRR